jgi:hypothetical protein
VPKSPLVRWAAVEAVQRTRAGTPMRARYEQVVTRPGATAKHVAKVAAARELLNCVFYALRDGRVHRLGHTGAAWHTCGPPRWVRGPALSGRLAAPVNLIGPTHRGRRNTPCRHHAANA